MTTTIIETCQISRPAPCETTNELSIPLTSSDIIWLHFHPIRRLLFYQHPLSNPNYFLQTLVPNLKHSLSLTLKHYLPISSNLIYPPNLSQLPVFRYTDNDSISLTIATSSNDFDHLIANHARDADVFYDFVPEIGPVRDEPEYQTGPVMALQVTLFPGRGVCFGFSNLHCLGDASSIVGFIQAWASITKFGGEDEFLREKGESLPIFDRSLIKNQTEIDSLYWKLMGEHPLKSTSLPLPTNKVRATFGFDQTDIKRLKDLVLDKKPGLDHVSSFVVTTSYVWSCLVKSEDAIGEEVDGNVLEYFIFAVDGRARRDPPVPANYFGNCLGYGTAKIEHNELVGDNGFVIAAEAVANDIKNNVNNKDEFMKRTKNVLSDLKTFMGARVFGVSGSPKFDLSSADFGWGNARKLEVLSIDGEKCSISLGKSSVGGLEVGLSLPKERMEAFTSIFASGLKFNMNNIE